MVDPISIGAAAAGAGMSLFGMNRQKKQRKKQKKLLNTQKALTTQRIGEDSALARQQTLIELPKRQASEMADVVHAQGGPDDSGYARQVQEDHGREMELRLDAIERERIRALQDVNLASSWQSLQDSSARLQERLSMLQLGAGAAAAGLSAIPTGMPSAQQVAGSVPIVGDVLSLANLFK